MTCDVDTIFTIKEPEKVAQELRAIMAGMHPGCGRMDIAGVVGDVAAIFAGAFPGYRRCTTGYHDLSHALAVALAAMRLLHGMNISGMSVARTGAECLLVAALFHDIGFIQAEGDVEGTGAKYATVHVRRGMNFAERYLANRSIGVDPGQCARIIRFTDLTPDLQPETGDQGTDLLGRVLASADLMAQMADPEYLDKLPLLYAEFVEGGVGGFSDEEDMVRKTPAFAEFVLARLRGPLGNLSPLVRHHFRVRWGLDEDLYAAGIARNMRRLTDMLREYGSNYRLALHAGIAPRQALPDQGEQPRAFLFSAKSLYFQNCRLQNVERVPSGWACNHRNRNRYRYRKVTRNRFRSRFRFRYRFRAPVVREQKCLGKQPSERP